MVKYNWTIDDIIYRLNYLEGLLLKEKDSYKRSIILYDIANLEDCIEKFFAKYATNHSSLIEKYNLKKEDYKSFISLKPHFITFNDITNGFCISQTLNHCSFSKNELLDLTHDFYRSLNNFFYRNFMKTFKNRFRNVKFVNDNDQIYRGKTITILSLQEAFTEIVRNSTAMDIITTIHEYMHATSLIINPYHFYPDKYIFNEIDTIFMELVGCDYLDQVLGNNTGLQIKGMNHLTYSIDGDDLANVFRIMQFESDSGEEFSKNRQLKNAALKSCNLVGEETEELFLETDTYPEAYITSYIIAIELYFIYKKDKDKALYYLRKIIELKDNSLDGYCKEIRKLGIVFNEHMQEFNDNLQSLLLTRKKPEK